MKKPYPRYKGNQDVGALLVTVEIKESGGAALYPDEEGYDPFMMDPRYVKANNLKNGMVGYFVVDNTDNKTFVIADEFEKNHARTSPPGKSKGKPDGKGNPHKN